MKEVDFLALPSVSIDSLLNDYHVTDGRYRENVVTYRSGRLAIKRFFEGTRALTVTVSHHDGHRSFKFEVVDVQ
jgi:hypothetical protein